VRLGNGIERFLADLVGRAIDYAAFDAAAGYPDASAAAM
jgi:hypothetical protein